MKPNIKDPEVFTDLVMHVRLGLTIKEVYHKQKNIRDHSQIRSPQIPGVVGVQTKRNAGCGCKEQSDNPSKQSEE